MVGHIWLDSDKIRVNLFILEFCQSRGCVFLIEVGDVGKSKAVHLAFDGYFLDFPDFTKDALELLLCNLHSCKMSTSCGR